MPVEFSQCDETRVVRFLDQTLVPREQADFEHHLEQCDACRSRLFDQTADPDSWNEASAFLRDEPFELAPLSIQTAPIDDTDTFRNRVTVDARRVVDFLSPTDDPRMLGRLGTYEIAGVIGSGGMGVVLKGFDAALNRYVAIKVLAPHLASSGAARKRFAREAQAAAAVVHDNVIEIHAVADSDDLPYLVMPYVRNESLQKRISKTGPLSLVEILRIGMQTAAGLAAAHAQGLVHRDVTPANILLADGVERVKLTDFGLARAADDASLTRTGVIAGTPQFMSPEQARGDHVDHRSDLFALGSVMYMMCTGHPPFRAESSYGILRRITDTQARAIREINPAIPAWVEAIVGKLHAKEPAARFQSAEEVAELLENCLAHVQQPTVVALPDSLSLGETSAAYGDRRRYRNRAFAIAGTITAICFIVVAAIINSMGDRSAENVNPPLPPATTPESSPFATQDDAELNAAWDDDTPQLIIELDHDAARLERRAGQLWENYESPPSALPAEKDQP